MLLSLLPVDNILDQDSPRMALPSTFVIGNFQKGRSRQQFDVLCNASQHMQSDQVSNADFLPLFEHVYLSNGDWHSVEHRFHNIPNLPYTNILELAF